MVPRASTTESGRAPGAPAAEAAPAAVTSTGPVSDRQLRSLPISPLAARAGEAAYAYPTSDGHEVRIHVVLATGSYPFVPDVPGIAPVDQLEAFATHGLLAAPLDPRMPPEKRDNGDHTNSRAIFYAVKPYHWKEKFPKATRFDRDTIRKVVAKYRGQFQFPQM